MSKEFKPSTNADAEPKAQEPGTNTNNIRQALGRRGVAAALAAVVAGGMGTGGVALGEHLEHSRAATLQEQVDYLIADKEAALLADQIDYNIDHAGEKDSLPIPMDVLNGKIVNKKSGAVRYKNAILLDSPNYDHFDEHGNFLKGAHLGEFEGRIDPLMGLGIGIAVVEFNPKTEKFVPNDPKQPVFVSMDVYPTQVGTSDDGTPSNYELIGYDHTGEQTYVNSDGSPIKPGS